MKVYVYDRCSTCKKALKFLDHAEVYYEAVPIVETPPSLKELKEMLAHLKTRGQGMGKLFNTSGELYRSMGMGEKLKSMTEAQALDMLTKHGKLIKRPFLLGKNVGLVGHNEDEWNIALGVKAKK